jgi:hypothetical protein
LTKNNKKKEPKINVLPYELLVFTLSYLMLAVRHQFFKYLFMNSSNIKFDHPLLSSYYRFILLPYYELVYSWTSVGYVQTISNDVAWTSPQLVPPLVSHVCHHSGLDLFLCYHKFIVACASQLRLVVKHVVS